MVSLVKARKKEKERKLAESEAAAAEASPKAEPVAAAPAAAVAPPDAAVVQTTAATPEPATKQVSLAEEIATAQGPASEDKLERFLRSANTLQRGANELVSIQQTSADVLELLLFMIAGEQYALTIDKIIEIVPPRSATRVPNADESVVGIISLRGTIVSILDIRKKLGHASKEEAGVDSRIIVVENEGETAGFLVDRVLRVVRVEPGQVESHPVVTSSEQSEFIRGVFQHNQKLSIFLDLERLLRF